MKDKNKKLNPEGYPTNPTSEDVYSKWKEEKELNSEDLTTQKTWNEKPGTRNEKDFADDLSGGDLDIPGSELDDNQEDIGSEDEANNYYSLSLNADETDETDEIEEQ